MVNSILEGDGDAVIACSRLFLIRSSSSSSIILGRGIARSHLATTRTKRLPLAPCNTTMLGIAAMDTVIFLLNTSRLSLEEPLMVQQLSPFTQQDPFASQNSSMTSLTKKSRGRRAGMQRHASLCLSIEID